MGRCGWVEGKRRSVICGDRISCGNGEANKVDNRSCKILIAFEEYVSLYEHKNAREEAHLLFPRLRVRSSGILLSCPGSNGERLGMVFVNHVSEKALSRSLMFARFLRGCRKVEDMICEGVGVFPVDFGARIRLTVILRISPAVICRV